MDFRVSIIITSYNQREYLVQAIESVLAQTLPAHEIIIADDCSEDDSREYILQYAERYPNLIKPLLQPKNVHIPRNRNAALATVTGNFVALLDGDDCFLPHKLETEAQVFNANPDIACVYSNLYFINSNGIRIRIRDSQLQPKGNIFPHMAGGSFGYLRSMLIKYEAIQKVGFMDVNFPKYDGLDLCIRLAKYYQFAYILEPQAEYRIHPDGDSRNLAIDQHLHDLEGIRKKMQPLFEDIDAVTYRKTTKRFRRVIGHVVIQGFVSALNSGNKIEAFRLLPRAFYYAPRKLSIKIFLQLLLPTTVYRILRKLWYHDAV